MIGCGRLCCEFYFCLSISLSSFPTLPCRKFTDKQSYDPPSQLYSVLFSSLLSIRRFFLRYLSLPRPDFLAYSSFTKDVDENDRVFITKWEGAPYYVKPTIWNRWGPGAWLTWLLGRPVPGDEGTKYYPQGYFIPDVGPKYFEGKGRTSLEKTMEEFKTTRTGGCPFH